MHEVNYSDVEQGTKEWLDLRMGKMSASRAKDLLATVKYGEAAMYKNYRAELTVERITGFRPERYVTKQMEYGTETETVAATMYSLQTGTVVAVCGIYTIEGKNVCASPDRLVGEDGLIEIKCRELANHIQSIVDGKVPREYYQQIQFQLWVTNRQWCDYVSYGDEMPENAQLFIKRIERDEDVINELIERSKQMEEDIAKMTETVTTFKLNKES